MHTIDPTLERMLSHLADKLGYKLTTGELNLYREELTRYGLYELHEAIQKAEADYEPGLYPSLAWFKGELSARLKETYLI